MAAWKPEVRFRKFAKNRMPDSVAFDYKQQTFAASTTFNLVYIFLSTWRDSAVGIVFRPHRLHIVQDAAYFYRCFVAWSVVCLSSVTLTQAR